MSTFNFLSGPGDVNLILDELSLIMPGETFHRPSFKSNSKHLLLDFLGAATVQAALEFMTPGRPLILTQGCWGPSVEFVGEALLHLCSLPLLCTSGQLRASTFTRWFAALEQPMQTMVFSMIQDWKRRQMSINKCLSFWFSFFQF